MCIFIIDCNHSLTYIVVRDLYSYYQHNASVQCTIGWLFFVQPIAAKCWRVRGGKLSRILGKNTILNEHPVPENGVSLCRGQVVELLYNAWGHNITYTGYFKTEIHAWDWDSSQTCELTSFSTIQAQLGLEESHDSDSTQVWVRVELGLASWRDE